MKGKGYVVVILCFVSLLAFVQSIGAIGVPARNQALRVLSDGKTLGFSDTVIVILGIGIGTVIIVYFGTRYSEKKVRNVLREQRDTAKMKRL